jgi:hypothetical protein
MDFFFFIVNPIRDPNGLYEILRNGVVTNNSLLNTRVGVGH